MSAIVERLEKNTPKEMKEAKRWLLWRSEEAKGEKPRKVPYYANGNRRAGPLDSNLDISLMASFSDAITVLKMNPKKYNGLGFALGLDGGKRWQGIDLDNVSANPDLALLAKSMPGYIEKSPSGDGFHAIGLGKSFPPLASNTTGIEAYSGSRFFTFTGKNVGGDVADISSYVESVLRPKHSPNFKKTGATSTDDDWDNTGWAVTEEQKSHLKSALHHIPADEYGLWVKLGMALASIGDAGRKLWIEWSKTDEKYNAAEANKKWLSFAPSRTGYEAVFLEAKKRGWINPLSKIFTHSSTHHESRPFRFSPVSELLREPKPLRWLIKDWVMPASVVFMVGAPSTGKSLLAIDWCCSVATGGDWYDKRVTKGTVVIIAGEGHHGIRRRLMAWSIDRGVDLSNSPLVVSDTSAALLDPIVFNDVMASLDEVRKKYGDIALVVVDTLNRNFGAGDENSAKDVGLYLQAADRIKDTFNSTVLTVHHSGHAEGGRARGSSAMRAGADIEYIVKSSQAGGRIVSCEKMKDAPKPDSLSFDVKEVELDWRKDDGDRETSIVFDVIGFSVGSNESPPRLTGHLRAALEALVSWPLQIGLFIPLSKREFRQEFYDAVDGSADARQRAFLRSVTKLIDQGCLAVVDEKYWPVTSKLAELWPSDMLIKDIVGLKGIDSGQADI
ncbi:AAA family ATPase [Zhongshania guokunii]|uniref:AAA family ATPase n=1 Tax=Zhongshania guokunii TaxID=641783 RepID=A0ABV3U925_9GAMM